ncbi:MAG: hypothetical protein J6S67_17300 [Methanobrevibacter sp.]|nr:hypothetical protein [Methanobrevibacter sp.]
MNDIYELVSNAKSTVWLNPGTYIIDKPLTPNPNLNTFLFYAIGATLIVKSDYMFNYNGDGLGIIGGIIKPLANSQLVNGQNTTAYFDKTQIANTSSFLANANTDIFPRFFPIDI